MEYLSIAGCLISLLLGIAAIIAPGRVGEVIGIQPVGPLGLSEIRATYGGLFVLFAAYCLATMSDAALMAFGLGWLGAGAVRLVTMFFQKFDFRNLGGVIVEATIGLMVASKPLFG
jgi:hypothetical protein